MFAYVAYNCKTMAQTSIQFASLQAFASTTAQPDGYPNAMPLNVAMQQRDWDKFIEAMAWELSQQTELKHWKSTHKSQEGSCTRNPEVEGPFMRPSPSPSVW